jgi:hypothetical protein
LLIRPNFTFYLYIVKLSSSYLGVFFELIAVETMFDGIIPACRYLHGEVNAVLPMA